MHGAQIQVIFAIWSKVHVAAQQMQAVYAALVRKCVRRNTHRFAAVMIERIRMPAWLRVMGLALCITESADGNIKLVGITPLLYSGTHVS